MNNSLPEDETTATTTRKQIKKAQEIFIFTNWFLFSAIKMLSRGCNQSAKISKDIPLTAGTHLRRQSLVVQESKTEDESCYHRCIDLWRLYIFRF